MAEAGLHLLQSITNLTNKILRGDLSHYAAKLLFSANLTALRKKDGGNRPVAVGNVFCRLAAKVGCHAVSSSCRCIVSCELYLIQLGCSVKGGARAAVHAVRQFITNKVDSDDIKIIVKLDMRNLFNATMFFLTCLNRTPRLPDRPFSPTANRHQSLLPVTR